MNETTTAEPAAKTAADLDIARKIWLAGVGAYGRILSETQGAVEKLASTANETFDDLVAKGEEVEDKVRKSLAKSPQVEKVAQAVESATSKVTHFTEEQRAALETRLGKVRETVAETLAPWNLPAIGQALEKLTTQVEALTHEVAALKAEKTPAADA
jgi:poly(hydroxyalkanoate) granule-associated protein